MTRAKAPKPPIPCARAGCSNLVPWERYRRVSPKRKAYCSSACCRAAERERLRAVAKALRAAGRCADCGSELDTASKHRCRACLDRNRDYQRKVRGGRLKKVIRCVNCLETGHYDRWCPYRSR